SSTYTLKLPEALHQHCIKLTFHISWLCLHEPNDDLLFSCRDVAVFYNFSQPDEEEVLVKDIIAHCWRHNAIQFLLQFEDGDVIWQTYNVCKDLEVLDHYLDLQGVMDWHKWLKRAAATHL
ncbi:uncharacterized protein LAESUDRAFT_654097, partial [Laetiporus sulphureus 93-53]